MLWICHFHSGFRWEKLLPSGSCQFNWRIKVSIGRAASMSEQLHLELQVRQAGGQGPHAWGKGPSLL